MDSILFVAHSESDGSLAKPAMEALAAACELAAALGGARLTVGLVGESVQPAANAVAGCGAAAFLGVTGAEFAAARYATDAAAAEALCRAAQPTVVVVPGTSRWNRVISGVAHRLGGRADTHVTGLAVANGAPAVTRWYYRQRLETVLQRAQRPWFLATDPGSRAPYTAAAGTATVQPVAVTLTDACRRTTVTGFKVPAADQQTIRPDAKLLLVAGAGWTKKQADGQTHTDVAKRLILGFLAKTQASLGGSKSLVDQSGEGQAVLDFMTHLHQVGQTGATPRHAKGLATCCHGEEPHVVGWRFVGERRAVNLDPNCGWARGKADVVYVGDAFQVMAKVNDLLAAKRS